MSNPVPNALALSTINDGDQAQAAPLRNNFSAIQSAVNLIRACLAGGSAGQLLQAADGTDVQWVTGVPLSAIYRKTTSKVVVNTVAETDLLNGEITVAANAMSTNRALRLTAFGDLINNTGAAVATPRIKLKLGATTLVDSSVVAAAWSALASRLPWRITALIQNLGAANSQWADMAFKADPIIAVASNIVVTTGEGLVVTSLNDFWSIGAGNAGAVDTTLAQLLALTVTLPTANALEDMTLKGALVEIV
jgi:hypothetical protein